MAMMPLCQSGLYITIDLCDSKSFRFSRILLASPVTCLSISFRVSLYWLMFSPFSLAPWGSLEIRRSTASLPDCTLPEALIRGPILKTISLVVISLFFKPQRSIMAFNPLLGLELSCLSPWKASIRFSSVIGTMSEAMLTAIRSSKGKRYSFILRLLLIAKACINLNPTPHPDKCW